MKIYDEYMYIIKYYQFDKKCSLGTRIPGSTIISMSGGRGEGVVHTIFSTSSRCRTLCIKAARLRDPPFFVMFWQLSFVNRNQKKYWYKIK